MCRLSLRCRKAGRFVKLLCLSRSHCDTGLSESLVRQRTTPFLVFLILTVGRKLFNLILVRKVHRKSNKILFS